MGTRIVPSSSGSLEERIQETVPYKLYYAPAFSVAQIGGKLDKDPEEAPWLQGLYEDIKEEGTFRNPLIVWNHHANRLIGKQPYFLVRAGSNLLWCAEQLGWDYVPAIVSSEFPLHGLHEIRPRELQEYFPDGGKIWANDVGFGLLAAKKPEETYKDSTCTTLKATTHHKRVKIISPYA